MPLNPDVLQQLMATFKVELDERLQTISDGLLELEKKPKKEVSHKIIEEIFRAAHNIKGSARSMGLQDIGEIVHHIESIFSLLREKKKKISANIINLCLEAVDAIHAIIKAHSENQPPNCDVKGLIARLQSVAPQSSRVTKTPSPTIVEAADDSEEGAENQKETQESNAFETIRVSLKQIDNISALIEQMQINKIGIEDHQTALIKLSSKCKQLAGLSSVGQEEIAKLCYWIQHMGKIMQNSVNELGLISNALQEEMQRLRLVPASSLLRHFNRLVRDLAQELNKKIAFEIRGDQVKLDKMILDGLKDPLMHLLRNAIDHGIENPEIRTEKGKPAEGKILIEVIDGGDQILINIEDDGAGIDVKKVADSAVKKKMLTVSELNHMQAAAILELIFRPEFSTQEIITAISGRGVGLDVVKSNLADLKGTVDFTTEVDKGTTFHLHLPLTLSCEIGLTIKSGGQLFIIPVTAIERVMMCETKALQDVEGRQVILFEQKPIPLVVLSDILNLERQELMRKDWLPIVLLKKGREKIALLVEEILGEREIVIKPLQPPLMNISCVAGGTLSGTGDIIIVLNPGDIIKQALASGKGARLQVQEEKASKTSPTQHHILLAEDSITTRTLEKNVLESNDYKVSIAVDGKEAWEMLQKQPFSLVITDIEMPNMDGFELTERIRQSEKYQDIPIIIVTSMDSEENKKRGIEAGANAYIMKHDFESVELLDIVGQLV